MTSRNDPKPAISVIDTYLSRELDYLETYIDRKNKYLDEIVKLDTEILASKSKINSYKNALTILRENESK
jgi:hypothetical protein